MSKVAVYMCVEWFVISQHSVSLLLIGPCQWYAWANAQAESVHQICVCQGVVFILLHGKTI